MAAKELKFQFPWFPWVLFRMIQENIARARKILHESETSAIFSCIILNINQYYITTSINVRLLLTSQGPSNTLHGINEKHIGIYFLSKWRRLSEQLQSYHAGLPSQWVHFMWTSLHSKIRTVVSNQLKLRNSTVQRFLKWSNDILRIETYNGSLYCAWKLHLKIAHQLERVTPQLPKWGAVSHLRTNLKIPDYACSKWMTIWI